MRMMTRMVPSDIDDLLWLDLTASQQILTLAVTQTAKPAIGILHITHLLLFNRNTAFADADLNATGLLPLLVELIAEDRCCNDKRADDEVENVSIHGPVAPFRVQQHAFQKPI